ncbi:MAG: hypothetical protein JWN90_282 [Parcubacteria group bacterium]|nr:hypothetical protein [Parcubacteria group bacterium]
MEIPDPFAGAERVLRSAHTSTERKFRPVYRRYPTLFLFLITFSVAALFHGLDLYMDEFPVFVAHPFVLVWLGVIGLFISGKLYKRLGKDKFEN